jgi:predicted nucleic acid-binding Zn ribbon protein
LKYPQKINKIMDRVLKSLHIDKRMRNWHIVQKWPDIVGSRIAQHAKASAVDLDTLYVEVDSQMWQSQLFLMKASIMKKIKESNGSIKDIKFKVVDNIDA